MMGEAKRRKRLDPKFDNTTIKDAQSFAKYICDQREEIEGFLLPFLRECAEKWGCSILDLAQDNVLQVDFVAETLTKVDYRISLNSFRNLPDIVQKDLINRLVEQKIGLHSEALNTLVFPVAFFFGHILGKQCSTTYIFVPGEPSQYSNENSIKFSASNSTPKKEDESRPLNFDKKQNIKKMQFKDLIIDIDSWQEGQLIYEFIWSINRDCPHFLNTFRDCARDGYKKYGRGVVVLPIGSFDWQESLKIFSEKRKNFLAIGGWQYLTLSRFNVAPLLKRVLEHYKVPASSDYVENSAEQIYCVAESNIKAYEPQRKEYNLALVTFQATGLVFEVGTLDKDHCILGA